MALQASNKPTAGARRVPKRGAVHKLGGVTSEIELHSLQPHASTLSEGDDAIVDMSWCEADCCRSVYSFMLHVSSVLV